MRRVPIALAIATGLALAVAPSVLAADEFDRYRIESASVELSSTQAGAHPDLTTSFKLAEAAGQPYGATRDVIVDLPPGLVGDPQAFPKCTTLQFGTYYEDSACQIDSQVGSTDLTINVGGAVSTIEHEPVYNMPAPGGDTLARFGFYAGPYPTFINVRLNPATNALVAAVEGASSTAGLIAASTTFWGVPAAPVHDPERLEPQEVYGSHGVNPPAGGRPSSLPEVPFMTNPTSCGEERSVTITARSYQLPESPSTVSAPFPQITGCALVPFGLSSIVAPTTSQGTTGTGLDYEVDFPTGGLEFSNLLVNSEIKRDEVVLPEGMTINPSEAVGLGVCSEADLARETYNSPPNAGCPETSKIGSVTAATPLIDRNPTGALYLAKPYENPFGSLLALYMTLKIPDRGVLVKMAGKVSLDQSTGRITTTFDDIPQLPVASFHLHFREGARAPLITPFACGAYRAISNMTPWSAPGSTVQKENTFLVESGPGHSSCPASATPPFAPTAITGTQSNAAGSYSPFYLRIDRGDGEQEITRFSTVMPTGLTGNLTGIPFCPDSAVEAARARTGRQELESPSCPAASEIGHSTTGAGVGEVLAQTPGKVYLAGPYHGAPLSLVSITSAVAGPFDLGTVVIRFALRINPTTAQVEVDSNGSDPIPHILDGIVVHVRDIRVYVDRPNFMINPTSCEPKSIVNTIAGAGADIANAADDTSATVASRFQAAECQALRFKPKFTASTSAHTSRKGGASLNVKLSIPSAPQGTMANLAKVKVTLPRQLPSRLATLQQACLDSVFEANPAACPLPSRVGFATTTTPIVPVPLSGPVYFVSHGSRAFPDLVIVLQGYGITVDLRGETHISKTGVTSTTFRTIPDVPVGAFSLTLPQGGYSALTNNGSLCNVKGGLKMGTSLVAQNGNTIKRSTPIAVSGCAKRKAAHRRHRSGRKAKR